ncbi:OmpA family protein [Kaarinaea lacus]
MTFKMNRFIETFAVATFPVALIIGCTTTGEEQISKIDAQQQIVVERTTSLQADEMNTVAFVEATNDDEVSSTATSTPETPTGNESSLSQNDSSNHETELMEVNLKLPLVEKMPQPETNIFHFAVNKYDLVESDYEHLKQHADYLKKHSQMILHVNGYSDARGPAKLNYELSSKRAQQVINILVTYGAPQAQIKLNSYGESFPLTDEKNWDENRRVELKYIEIPNEEGLLLSAF